MNIKVSKIVPNGYSGITLWPFGIYVSNEAYLNNESLINHEKIHWEQQKELLGIFFYVLYGLEWIIKRFIYKSSKVAYKELASEREAYHYDDDLNYLSKRKRYKWLKYIFKQY